MAGYTNKDNEFIEVSDSHIETAIEIKLQLQKASPSFRCSWAKHKKMMEKEGYYDSENSENYRQFVKQEQGKRGKLPSVATHADMVADSKLQSIKDEIGEISVRKREAQNNFRELNKLKRELTDDVLFVEAIHDAVKGKDFGLKVEHVPTFDKDKPKKKMIAGLSDIHYGALVDVEGRYYDTKVAEKYIVKYTEEIERLAIKENVEEIYLMNLGDIIEHISMRAQNFFGTDKVLAEQVTEVSDLIIEMLKKLSVSFKVKYSGINGNHDRSSGRKQDEIYKDGMASISNKIVETYVKYGNNENVEFIEAEPYHHIITLGSRNFLFVHGDKHNLKKDTVLAEQSGIYGIDFDAIIGGHIHHFTTREVAEDKYIVTFGSIKGTDEFSLKTIGATASRSQGVVLVDENDEFEIKQVKL